MSHPASSNPASSTRIALVLGITGGLGHALAIALHGRGYAIRALSRDPAKAAATAKLPFAVDWLQGDAFDRGAVLRAAAGTAVIAHAVNPPGYAKWREKAVPMLANSIVAAQHSGARILFPGNIYAFGPEAGAVIDEASPQNPNTVKGAVRMDMEAMLRHAADHGVRSLIVRAGDFFGPDVPNSWFGQALVKGGRAATVIQDLGAPGIGHSWAYAPDLAETFMRLLDRQDRLATHDVFHFQGHWFADGRDLAEAVRYALGGHVPIRRFFWPQIYLIAPFVTFFCELIEMRWLWRESVRLDNRKLEAVIGPEPHTPLAAAIEASLGPASIPARPGPATRVQTV
jgi:nucleoside-diphosphate-sugar epimerase